MALAFSIKNSVIIPPIIIPVSEEKRISFSAALLFRHEAEHPLEMAQERVHPLGQLLRHLNIKIKVSFNPGFKCVQDYRVSQVS